MAPDERDLSQDEKVDEASEGSFPASDPPPWTLGCEPTDDAPDSEVEERAEEASETDEELGEDTLDERPEEGAG